MDDETNFVTSSIFLMVIILEKVKKVKIKIGNVKCRLFGYLPDEVLDEINNELAFQKKNIEWSSKVIDGKWDGYTRLFDRYKKTFYTGLLSLVYNALKKHGYQMDCDDQRTVPFKNRDWKFVLPENVTDLYDFQKEAIRIAKKSSRGIFSIATGAGKTLTFTSIIHELQTAPVIIYVPTLLLLYQTKNEIEKVLRDKNGNPVEVGIVGNGQCDIKDITVMTIQTAITAFDMEYDKNQDIVLYLTPEQIQKKNENLQKKKKVNYEDPDATEDLSFVTTRKEVLQDLIKNTKVVICDECHRASSSIYQAVLKKSPLAYYRFAFSATATREDNTEMLIQAIFGKILLHISCSELIRRPDVRIVRPYIFMIDVPDFQDKDFLTYHQIRKNCIVMSETRNQLIADVTEYIKKYGPTLLLVGIIDHGKILEKMIPGSLFIHAKTPEKKKKKALEDLMSGDLNVLIASPIIDEGLNIPGLKVLILCDSGKAATKLYQRVGRVVREIQDKKYGIVLDFKDNNDMLKKHAKHRETLYLLEDEWVLTNIAADKIKTIQANKN